MGDTNASLPRGYSESTSRWADGLGSRDADLSPDWRLVTFLLLPIRLTCRSSGGCCRSVAQARIGLVIDPFVGDTAVVGSRW